MQVNRRAISKAAAVALLVIIVIAAVGLWFTVLKPRPKPIPTPTPTPTLTPTPTPTLTPTPTSTPSPTPKPPVKIGFMGPLKIWIGQNMLKAVQMAVEEINAQGGVLGHPIELVTYDDENKPEKGTSGYTYLVEQGCKVIFGPFGSHVALALLDHIAVHKVLTISYGAVSDEIDKRVAENPKYKYWFRGYVNATSQAAATWDIIAYYCRKFGIKKVAWFYEDLAWTIPHAQYGQKRAPKEGIEIVYVHPFPPDVKSFVEGFAKAKEAGAQLIILQASLTEDPVFTRDYTAQKVALPVLGGTTLAMMGNYWNVTAGGCQGFIMIAWGYPTDITAKTMAFYKKFVEKYGEEPFFTSWYVYDDIYMWKAAVEKAGTFDSDALVPVLEEMEYTGVCGVYKFTKGHTVLVGPEYIYPLFFQWRDGKRVVVWPKRLVKPGTTIIVPKEKDGEVVFEEVSWP